MNRSASKYTTVVDVAATAPLHSSRSHQALGGQHGGDHRRSTASVSASPFHAPEATARYGPHAIPAMFCGPLVLIYWAYYYVIGCAISAEDTYQTLTRKLGVTCMFLISLVTLWGGNDFYNYGVSSSTTTTTAAGGSSHPIAPLVGGIGRFIFGVVITLPLYLHIRFNGGQMTDRLTWFGCMGTMAALSLCTVAFEHFSVETTFYGISGCYIVLNAGHPLWPIALSTLVLSVRVVNQVWPGVLMVPGYHETDAMNILLHRGVALPTFWALMFLLWTLQREFHKKLAAIAASAELASIVSSHLAQYNTEAVDALLTHHEQATTSRGTGSHNTAATTASIDPDLLNSMRQLCSNLKLYKPHLPNYVLPQAPDVAADSEGNVLRVSVSESKPAPRAQGEGAAYDGGSSHTQATNSFVESVYENESSPFASGGGSAPSNRFMPLAAAAPYRGHGVVSRLIFTYDTTDILMTHKVVRAVFDAGYATSASIHAFIGDCIVASWNATKRVGRCEAKACRFACAVAARCSELVSASAADVHGDTTQRLIDFSPPRRFHCAMLPLDAPVRVSGAVCSGPIQSLFAGDNQRQLFSLSHQGWEGRLQEATDLGRKCGCLIIDGYTKEHAQFDVQTRGVSFCGASTWQTRHLMGYAANPKPASSAGLISLLATPSSSSQSLSSRPSFESLLYQVVSEREEGGGFQEWMYDVEAQHQDDPDQQLTAALKALVGRNPAEAVRIMNRLQEEASDGNGRGLATLLGQPAVVHLDTLIHHAMTGRTMDDGSSGSSAF